jgi:site-specific DNA-methyltransferase (adenine-specific)/modification methylase
MSGEGTLAEVLDGRARWCVIEGDCLEVLPTLADKSVDAVVTDPPYGIGEAAGKNASRGKLAVAVDYGNDSWDDEPASAASIAELRRVSAKQIVWGGNYFHLPPSRCWLVWDKNGANDFADCELAWTNLGGAVRRIVWQWNGMLRRGKEPRQHPTQKPLGVMLWALGFVGDATTILDPFAGSGTTGVAALRLGRRVVLIEREPRWAELCRERLRAEESGSTLGARRAGQVPMFGGER